MRIKQKFFEVYSQNFLAALEILQPQRSGSQKPARKPPGIDRSPPDLKGWDSLIVRTFLTNGHDTQDRAAYSREETGRLGQRTLTIWGSAYQSDRQLPRWALRQTALDNVYAIARSHQITKPGL